MKEEQLRVIAGRYLQVSTTTDTRESADRLARLCVEKRLAACVQVISAIRSTYHWKGKLENTREWLCLMKTLRSLYPALERAILQAHPYEVPEIVAVPMVAASESYRRWMDAELRPVKRPVVSARKHKNGGI